MERPNFWGKLIVELREGKGLSQRTLASEAGVCRSTLRRIEAGSTPGDMDIMERVFGHLGYELEALDKEAVEALKKRRLADVAPEAKSDHNKKRILSLRLISSLHE